jgi:hypothetical protein
VEPRATDISSDATCVKLYWIKNDKGTVRVQLDRTGPHKGAQQQANLKKAASGTLLPSCNINWILAVQVG